MSTVTATEWKDAKAQAWRRLCEKAAALGTAFAEFDVARKEYAGMVWADAITESAGEETAS